MQSIKRILIPNYGIKRLFSKSNNIEIELIQKELSLLTEKKTIIKLKDWSLYKSTPEGFDQSNTNVFLFPGHGTQFVGMCKNLVDLSQVKVLFESASSYLNFDLLKMCLEGPVEKLNTISNSHVAIYISSIAAIEKVKHETPELIENCIAAAGYDLGEITSLVFAGVLTFEQGLHFVRVRAEEIEKACQNANGGLLMVTLRPKSELNQAMLAAKKYCFERLEIETPVCELATNLFTECKIIGGHIEALEFIERFSREFRLRSVRILTSNGAFNTSLMKPAVTRCRIALQEIGDIKKPNIHVFSNTTGNIHNSQRNIKLLLSEQISKLLRWEQILHRVYARPSDKGHPNTIEVGPKSTLVKTLSKVNLTAVNKYQHISV